MVGDTSVGKSSLGLQYVSQRFNLHIPSTTGASFLKKDVVVGVQGEQTQARVLIIDSAGQEKFRSLTHMYYRTAAVIFLVFDVCRGQSFQTLDYWLGEIREKATPGTIVAVIGNKIDKQGREVPEEQAREFCGKQKLQYFECSAFNGAGVEEAFRAVLEERVLQIKAGREDAGAGRLKVVPEEIKSGCC